MTRQVQIYTRSCHEGRFSSEDVLISALCSESRDSSRMSTGDLQVRMNVDEPHQDSGGSPENASSISTRELVASPRRVHRYEFKEPDGTGPRRHGTSNNNKLNEHNSSSESTFLSHPLYVISYHHRKPSFTSSPEGHSNFDEPEPDHGGMVVLQPARSDLTSTVACPYILWTELVQNQQVDPRPFSFRPFQLASLLDPKNLNALYKLGGIHGLLKGLGTDSSRGSTIDHRNSSDTSLGAGLCALQRYDRMDNHPLPSISVIHRPTIDDRNSFPHLASLGGYSERTFSPSE